MGTNIKQKNRILVSFENLGIKPRMPKCLQSHYVAMPVDKYITLSIDKDFNGYCYPYWQEVIDLIAKPLFDNGIEIVDVSLENNGKQNLVYKPQIELNVNRVLGILKGSALHFGNHNWVEAILPTVNNNKSVIVSSDSLYQNPFSDNFSYSKVDEKPEKIAQSILSLIGIDSPILIETIYTGSSYPLRIVEIVPDSFLKIPNGNFMTSIRFDLCKNYEAGLQIFQTIPNSHIIIDEDLPIEILSYLIKSPMLSIKITNKISKKFLSLVHNSGCKYSLRMLNAPKEEFEKAKADFFDFNPVLNLVSKSKKDLQSLGVTSNTKVRSRKTLVNSNGEFVSVYHMKRKLKIDTEEGITVGRALDNKIFLAESDHFMFYDYKSTN